MTFWAIAASGSYGLRDIDPAGGFPPRRDGFSWVALLEGCAMARVAARGEHLSDLQRTVRFGSQPL